MQPEYTLARMVYCCNYLDAAPNWLSNQRQLITFSTRSSGK